MSKNKNEANKKGPTKKPAQAPAAPKPAPKPTPKVEDSAEVESVEEVTIPQAADPKSLTSRKHSNLSADGQVRLLDLAHRVFVEEQDPDLQFPQTVRVKVNKLVAIGVLCSFADHAANGDNSFAVVLQSQAYPALSAAAEELNIKLPDVKALPAGKEPGTVVLNSGNAGVHIPAEMKAELKKEENIRKGEKPELDPEKITSEEDVTKALQYMFLSSGGKRLSSLLTEAIDFMKKFRMHEASMAENADEAKARFDNYNSGDWLDDVFSYFRPPVFFAGIGKGMATVAAAKKNPIHSFIILRDAIKDKETGKPALEDQEIAYCVKSIIKWYCNTNIDSNKKAIENLNPKKNKSEIEKCEAQIQHYNDILAYITNPSSEEADSLLEKVGIEFDANGMQLTTECQEANATFNRICKSFYGKELSDADYKNLGQNVQQYAGIILNLFREPGSQLASYSLSNISDLEERSDEEREALIKKAKKAWAERKTKEKEEESKNA